MTSTSTCYCGERSVSTLTDAWDRLRGRPGVFRIVQCHACGTIRTDPRLSSDDLSPFYLENAREDQIPQDTSWSRLAGKLRSLGPAGRCTERWMFPENSPLDYGRPGRVLDIGCGQGALLDRLREAGWETWGIDADERAAAAVARRGHRALAGEFRRDRFGSNRFDLIWMFHSLEHMHDPLLACTDAGNLLAPGGVLMLRAPATSGILPRWRLSDWYNLDVPRHLWHFSPATLTALLARAGFHVIVLQTYSTWVDYAATVRNAWRSWRGGVGPTSSPPFGPWTAILFRLAWAAAARPLDLVGCGDRMFVVATRHS